MKDPTVRYWLWLALCCGPASPYANLLCDRFAFDAEAIYRLSQEEVEMQLGLPKPLLAKLANKDLTEADTILDWCRANGVRLLHPAMTAYPDKLRSIERMPLVLYYRGTLPNLDDCLCLALVGTRRMTEYGKHIAYTVSHDLAKAGVVTVSGMALGIDGMVHRATIDAGGRTIAVLGCGIDRAYPTCHADLMQEIAYRGAVITEYKPFTKPFGANFPLRNRIIAALSQGTAVIEADSHSGALITARYALYQGKDVFAIPGKVGEVNSDGVHQLIKDGAKLVTRSVELLKEYLPLYEGKIFPERIPKYEQVPYTPMRSGAVWSSPKRHEAPRKAVSAPTEAVQDAPKPQEIDLSALDAAERDVYLALANGPCDADALCRLAKRTTSEVSLALTMLEIKQIIKALPGGQYRRL